MSSQRFRGWSHQGIGSQRVQFRHRLCLRLEDVDEVTDALGELRRVVAHMAHLCEDSIVGASRCVEVGADTLCRDVTAVSSRALRIEDSSRIFLGAGRRLLLRAEVEVTDERPCDDMLQARHGSWSPGCRH